MMEDYLKKVAPGIEESFADKPIEGMKLEEIQIAMLALECAKRRTENTRVPVERFPIEEDFRRAFAIIRMGAWLLWEGQREGIETTKEWKEGAVRACMPKPGMHTVIRWDDTSGVDLLGKILEGTPKTTDLRKNWQKNKLKELKPDEEWKKLFHKEGGLTLNEALLIRGLWETRGEEGFEGLAPYEILMRKDGIRVVMKIMGSVPIPFEPIPSFGEELFEKLGLVEVSEDIGVAMEF